MSITHPKPVALSIKDMAATVREKFPDAKMSFNADDEEDVIVYEVQGSNGLYSRAYNDFEAWEGAYRYATR